MSITYEIGLGLTGADQVTSGAAAVRKLREELAQARGEGAFGGALPRAVGPARGAGSRTPRAAGGDPAAKAKRDSERAVKVRAAAVDNSLKIRANFEKQEERAQAKATKDAERAAEKRRKDALGRSQRESGERSSRGLAGVTAKFGGAVSAAVAAAAAATALASAGVAALTPLALGWRGMAQLQFITFRTTFMLRRLFSGVDPSPVVRAYDRLTRGLDKTTVTGRILSGILTRGFNGFFSLIERAQPYVTSFGQGVLYGMLKVEAAFIRVRIAMLPYTDALEDLLGDQDRVGDAFDAGAALAEYFGTGLAVAAVGASFLAKALGFVVDRFKDISKLPSNVLKLLEKLSGQETDVGRGDRGKGFRADNEASRQVALAVPDAASASAQSQPLGMAMADGMVAGIRAKLAELTAAGEAMPHAVNTGVRKGGQIHSPSGLTRESAHRMGDGVVVGMRDKKSAIDLEASKSLVPTLDARRSFTLPARGGAASVQVSVELNFSGAHDAPEDIGRIVRREVTIAVNDALMQMGGG